MSDQGHCSDMQLLLGPRAKLVNIQEWFCCKLCAGYLIDATTITECMHSFCRSCIVRFLETESTCPICEKPVHKTKPLEGLRADKTLQDIVYKLVPGLFKKEMTARRAYYAKSAADDTAVGEQRGDVTGLPYYDKTDKISLSLEYGLGENQVPNGSNGLNGSQAKRRFLRCDAGMPVALLKEFVLKKYALIGDYSVSASTVR